MDAGFVSSETTFPRPAHIRLDGRPCKGARAVPVQRSAAPARMQSPGIRVTTTPTVSNTIPTQSRWPGRRSLRLSRKKDADPSRARAPFDERQQQESGHQLGGPAIQTDVRNGTAEYGPVAFMSPKRGAPRITFGAEVKPPGQPSSPSSIT